MLLTSFVFGISAFRCVQVYSWKIRYRDHSRSAAFRVQALSAQQI